jgi:hypothetical protein
MNQGEAQTDTSSIFWTPSTSSFLSALNRSFGINNNRNF